MFCSVKVNLSIDLSIATLHSYLQSIHAARRQLFTTEVGLDMRCFMSQRDQEGVFWFILDCLREVEELENLDRSLDVDLGLPVEHDTYD